MQSLDVEPPEERFREYFMEHYTSNMELGSAEIIYEHLSKDTRLWEQRAHALHAADFCNGCPMLQDILYEITWLDREYYDWIFLAMVYSPHWDSPSGHPLRPLAKALAENAKGDEKPSIQDFENAFMKWRERAPKHEKEKLLIRSLRGIPQQPRERSGDLIMYRPGNKESHEEFYPMDRGLLSFLHENQEQMAEQQPSTDVSKILKKFKDACKSGDAFSMGLCKAIPHWFLEDRC